MIILATARPLSTVSAGNRCCSSTAAALSPPLSKAAEMAVASSSSRANIPGPWAPCRRRGMRGAVMPASARRYVTAAQGPCVPAGSNGQDRVQPPVQHTGCG